MFSPFERMVAFRYLRARKQEGFVSVIATISFIGIMIGVAALIIVMSVMNGFREELITRILGLNGHLNVYSIEGGINDYEKISKNISKIDGVVFVAPMIEGQVLVTGNGVSIGAVVRGFTPKDFKSKPIISNSIISGDIDNFKDDNIAIGIKMAEKLNVRVGDKITIMTPKGRSTPFGTSPRARQFVISTIFDVGMSEYNSSFIFMPLKFAQKFFQTGNKVNMLEVVTKKPDDMDDIKEDIRFITDVTFNIYDWREANKSYFNALKTERNVMFLILTLIVLVASLNIVSSMFMLVKDKGSDIAIMRTMGASKLSMLKIFILTGASIGFVGTAAGAVLGISFALNIDYIKNWLEGLTGAELFSDEIYFLSKLPAIIDWNEVLLTLVIAFALSFLATLYPAWRASRLDPVEALRYE